MSVLRPFMRKPSVSPLLYPARLRANKGIIGLVLMTAGCLFNYFVGRPLPMSADNVLIAAGFISAGIWFSDHTPRNTWYNYLLPLLLYAVFFVLSTDSTRGKGIEMYDCRYGNYFYFVIMALSALFFILLAIRRLPDISPLCWLGRNSLLIYCTHTMILQIPYSVEKRLPALLPDKELQAFLFSLLATLFVCLVTVPIAAGINRYLPWMLGKKRPE